MSSYAYTSISFCLYAYGNHRDLHSFPTRRSSDLWCEKTNAVRPCARHRHEYRREAWVESRRARCPESTDLCKRSRDSSSRSEEHTSELQSQSNLVCRLLLEKKNSREQTLLTLNPH